MEFVRRPLSELPSGSYLMVTRATADFTPEESKAATEKPVPGQDDGVIPGYGAVGRKP